MKKNDFAEEYRAYEELKAAYDRAKEAGDEAGQQAARDGYDAWEEKLNAKGGEYVRVYKLYEEAKECGNGYIDLHDTIWDNQVEGLIKSLREFGIERFTFSSTWSSAVETAWLFTKQGCILEDLVEINSRHKAFMSDEHEKAHGYLFRIAE